MSNCHKCKEEIPENHCRFYDVVNRVMYHATCMPKTRYGKVVEEKPTLMGYPVIQVKNSDEDIVDKITFGGLDAYRGTLSLEIKDEILWNHDKTKVIGTISEDDLSTIILNDEGKKFFSDIDIRSIYIRHKNEDS